MAKPAGSIWGARIGLAVLGALLGLTQVPFSLIYLSFLCTPFLVWIAINRDTLWASFGVGWWAGLGYFAVTLHWIVEPFFVEPEIFGWIAPFGLALMAGGAALFWAIPFGLTKLISTGGRRDYLILVALWCISEYLRSFIFTGFPWGLLSYAWVGTGVDQWSAVFGPHGLMFVTILILIVPAIYAHQVWQAGIWSLCLIAALAATGLWRISWGGGMQPTSAVVRLVQPNAEQHLKWRADMVPIFFNRALQYTGAYAERRPDMVIWPETALPFFLGRDPEALQRVADAAGPKTELVAGIRRFDDNGGYNSLVHLGERGGVRSVYDKHHLVPFGEYLPFQRVFSAVGLRAIADNIGGFSAGEGTRVLKSDRVPDFLPMICYEAIFPYHARAQSRPDWLIHVTNDAWFGTFSGPYQHLVQAQMRSIEQGLPMARAANTGISAMIDPYGQIVAAIPLGRADYIDVALPKPLSKTIYAKTGEWPWLILVFGILALCTRNPRQWWAELR